METKRRQLIERRDKVLATVQDLEIRLGITSGGRWDPTSAEWAAAAEKVRMRRYQRALDILEGLVVARIFELSKMNMSETGASIITFTLSSTVLVISVPGYKLRKHIAKALQTRSHSIKKALQNYNAAAMVLRPRAPKLTWEKVVEYAFLADFDLLRAARQDIREKPWAKPANRTLRDTYFKMERAREEIERLNVEIRRVITYMRDEELYLENQESAAKDVDPELAHQIYLYKMQRARTHSLHLTRFRMLSVERGFTGQVIPGYGVDATMEPAPQDSVDMDSDSDEEDIKDITYKVLSVSDDAREVEVFDSWYDFSLIMQIQDLLMNFQIALFYVHLPTRVV
jgi:hypothetical protein